MPVFIQDPDAFEKLVEVEGEEYRKYKGKDEFKECSFDAFLKQWKEETKNRPDLIERGKDVGLTVEGNGAIYGLWGWNRYAVYYSGEITFIPEQAWAREAIRRAKKAGFRTSVY